MARPNHISISAGVGWGDCDDCGSFSHGTATFVVDGDLVLEVRHDGHFGAEWDGEPLTLYRYALGLAGVAPRINGEVPEGIPLVDSGKLDECNSALWVPVHELGEWEFVDVELIHLGDDEHYPTPVRANWIGADGASSTFLFDPVNPDWAPFWRAFSQSFALVDLDWATQPYGGLDD